MLDVHLMVERPELVKYIEAGANIVTVHYEAFKSNRELIKTLKLIRKKQNACRFKRKAKHKFIRYFSIFRALRYYSCYEC